MGKLLARVTLLCCFVASPGPALAGAGEASRAQTTVTIGQNTVTADSSVKCAVTGEIRNVNGSPSGLARLNLAPGVNTDCDLATGNADGIDGATTIRMEIRVSTGSGDGDRPASGGAIGGVRA